MNFYKYWLPVIIWMAMIFSASTDSFSAEHTSRFLSPLIRWQLPDISEEALERVHAVVRKIGHLTEYAILAGLVWRARRMRAKDVALAWNWPDAGFALLWSALFAASDEFHQAFVPSRQASTIDVSIDTAGALLGLLILWVITLLTHRRMDDLSSQPS